MKHIDEIKEIQIAKAWLCDKPRANRINKNVKAIHISRKLEKIVNLRIHFNSVIRAADELGIANDGYYLAMPAKILENQREYWNEWRSGRNLPQLPYKYHTIRDLDLILGD